jgi:hypothetical protein
VTFLQDGTETREVYNPPAPLLLHVYTVTHFLLALALLDALASSFQAGFPEAGVLKKLSLAGLAKLSRLMLLLTKGFVWPQPALVLSESTIGWCWCTQLIPQSMMKYLGLASLALLSAVS